MLILSSDINNIVIIAIEGVGFGFIVYGVSKSNATHLLESSVPDHCGFI